MDENTQPLPKPARFLGHFDHILDDRGRVSLPAKFRDRLGTTVIITKRKGRFLVGYTETEWERFSARMDGLSVAIDDDLDALQLLYGDAFEQEIDKQGRILIPPDLRQYAGIKGDVVIEGLNSRITIWDKENWLVRQTVRDANSPQIIQRLGERGIIM